MFSDRLRTLRLDQGWSQQELGERLNVSSKTISGYEHKVSQPSIDVLIKLSKIFDVTVDYLIGNSECKKEENSILLKELGLKEEAIESLKWLNSYKKDKIAEKLEWISEYMDHSIDNKEILRRVETITQNYVMELLNDFINYARKNPTTTYSDYKYKVFMLTKLKNEVMHEKKELEIKTLLNKITEEQRDAEISMFRFQKFCSDFLVDSAGDIKDYDVISIMNELHSKS